MPFSSLNDSVDLARAQAALDAAWIEVEPTIPDAMKGHERTTLAYIVAGLAAAATDEDELRRRAIETYRRQLQE